MKRSKQKYLYVKPVKRAGGSTQYYFRPPNGLPRGIDGRLPDEFGSQAFKQQHADLLRIWNTQSKIMPVAPKPTTKQVAFLPGQIGAFIPEFMASTAFRKYSPGTRYNYGKALDFLRDRRGGQRLDETTTAHIDKYTRTIESASMADLQVDMISLLWGWAKNRDHFRPRGRPNPAAEASKRYGDERGDGHLKWPQPVQNAFIGPGARPHEITLFHLLRETGQRLGDVANMQWDDYVLDPNGDDEMMIVIDATEKTGETVFVAVTETLRKILDNLPRDCAWILSKNGKPLKKGTLSHLIGRRLTKLGYGRRGTAEATYSAHGLRKNCAIEMAENGAGTPAIQAQLGQRSPQMAAFYVKQADNSRLAREAIRGVNAGRKATVTPMRRKAG
jgi:integrase